MNNIFLFFSTLNHWNSLSRMVCKIKDQSDIESSLQNVESHCLNLNQSNFHLFNQWFNLLPIHQWKWFFSLSNQLIFTDSSVEKIFFTVKSVNFHLSNYNQWILTDSDLESTFNGGFRPRDLKKSNFLFCIFARICTLLNNCVWRIFVSPH